MNCQQVEVFLVTNIKFKYYAYDNPIVAVFGQGRGSGRTTGNVPRTTVQQCHNDAQWRPGLPLTSDVKAHDTLPKRPTGLA